MTETRACGLVFDSDRRVAAVETSRGTLAVSDEVVVACGAIESPKLLLNLTCMMIGEKCADLVARGIRRAGRRRC